MGFPYIFTFYSYKGGVGRSMAVLNTAYTLAGWGKHVLVVDLDLEAPGVSSFLTRHGELAPSETERPLDVLTLLQEIVNGVREGRTADRISQDLPPLENYLRHVDREKLEPLKPRIGTPGRLDVLAADMERNWCGRLANLKLQDLPQDHLVAASSAMHYYLKRHRFPSLPTGSVESDPPQETPYDYVLIDSRTGITEIGGLCVGPLADRLVVLSSLNDQNIEGTRTFLEVANIHMRPRSPLDKPRDAADQPGDPELPTLGPKPTILVASPVPSGEIDFKRQRLKILEERIGIPPSRLSYHPQMALFESVFVRDYREEYLAREYLELASQITRQVADHPSQLAAEAARMNQQQKPFEALPSVFRLAAQAPDLAESLLISIANFFVPTTDAERTLASRTHGILADIPSHRSVALSRWGSALYDQARTKQGAEADRLFAEAFAKYEAALKIKPDYHEALNNWGNALSYQARTKQGEEADRLFAEAIAKYEAALKIKPDAHEALNNWGYALYDQARTKQGEEADRLFARANEKLLKSEAIQAGSAAFNLACVASLQGRAADAVHWLEVAASSHGPELLQLVERDSDFDRIRKSSEYQKWVASQTG